MLAPRSGGRRRIRNHRGDRRIHARRLARGDAAERGRRRGAEGRAARRHACLSQRGADAAAGGGGRAGGARARGRARAGAASGGAQLRQRRRARALPRPADRRGGRAPPAGDRGRPRRAGRAVPRRAGGDQLRADRAARHRGDRHLGLSGRPSAHCRITSSTALLAAKLEAAAQTGLKVEIVTQFCLDAAPILAWVKRLRAHGIDHPVRIGLAGPTSLTTLMRYAQALRRARLDPGARAQCRADQAPARRRGAGRHRARAGRGQPRRRARRHRAASVFVRRHRATARWVAAAAAGRIRLDREGFAVEAG